MRLLIIALVLVGTAAAAPVFSTEIPQFRRGDVTGDGVLNIADPTVLIEIVYNNGPINCADANDVNDDGNVNVADIVTLLNWIFNQTLPQPAPGPMTCGIDPTPDALDCESYPCPPIPCP